MKIKNKKIQKKSLGGKFNNFLDDTGNALDGNETNYDFRRNRAIAINEGGADVAKNVFGGILGTTSSVLNQVPGINMLSKPLTNALGSTKVGKTAGFKLGQGVGNVGYGVAQAVGGDGDEQTAIAAALNIGTGISQGLQGGGKIAQLNNDQNTSNWLNTTGTLGEQGFQMFGQLAGALGGETGNLEGMKKYGGFMKSNGGYESNNILEKYKLLPHSQLNPNFANAQLDGKPIQMEKNETIFRAANGGNYAFSPNIPVSSGRTAAEESIYREKLHSKPYYDKAAQDTLKFSLNDLVKENEAKRQIKENRGLPKASGGFTFGDNTTGIFNNTELLNWASNTGLPMGTMGATSIQSNNPSTLTPNLTKADITKTVEQPTESFKTSAEEQTQLPGGLLKNLTTGDKTQLAGMLPALGYNLARSLEKPEKQGLYLDKSPITEQRIKADYNPMFLSQNMAKNSINTGSTSDAVRRANLVNLTSNMQKNIGNYNLGIDNANAAGKIQFESRINDRTNKNIATKYAVDDINSRNKAARNMFGAQAATNLGQGLTTFGQGLNQGKTNEIQYSALQDLASNYGLSEADLESFLVSKGKKNS